MRTVRIDSCWTRDRIVSLARLACDVAVVLDADDYGDYELRMALGGEFFYDRPFDRKEDVEREPTGQHVPLSRTCRDGHAPGRTRPLSNRAFNNAGRAIVRSGGAGRLTPNRDASARPERCRYGLK